MTPRLLLAALLSLPLCIPSHVLSMPTPKLDEGEMEGQADLVVEGTVAHVTLLKRWIGDRQGIDTGYECGEFESQLTVSKVIKGNAKEKQAIKYFVSAYMEGTWDNPPPMGFVYENTKDAVTPGTKMRAYLKWNEADKRYERVQFNSGFVVLESSDLEYPRTVGGSIEVSNKSFERTDASNVAVSVTIGGVASNKVPDLSRADVTNNVRTVVRCVIGGKKEKEVMRISTVTKCGIEGKEQVIVVTNMILQETSPQVPAPKRTMPRPTTGATP